MAIQQTKKQSDLEKRLNLLRQQVYSGHKSDHQPQHTNSLDMTVENYSDITYLYQDLFKILVFSSVAIGIQVILFFLSKNHILNLNFF